MRSIFLFFLFIGILQADAIYNHKIILATFKSQSDADKALVKTQKLLQNNNNFIHLQKSNGFKLVARASEPYFVLVIEPFSSSKPLKYILKQVKKIYPDAFSNRIVSKKTLIKKAIHVKPIVKQQVQNKSIDKIKAYDKFKISDLINWNIIITIVMAIIVVLGFKMIRYFHNHRKKRKKYLHQLMMDNLEIT